MKNKVILVGSLFLITGLLSSCNFKDPTKEFLNEARQYFLKAKENKVDGELFYYDGTSTRCAVYVLNDDNEYETQYLGLLNFTNLSFSETKDYFFDLGNLDIKLDTTGGDLSVSIPGYFDENGLNINEFLNKPPFVLVRKNNDSYSYLSGINNEGSLIQESNVNKYDPIFYYLDDFKYTVNEYVSFDYSGKKLAILRVDLLQYLSDALKKASLPSFLNFSEAMFENYRKINGIEESKYLPSSIDIVGEKDGKEVVIGPLAYTELFGYEDESGNKQSFLNVVETVNILEGVKEATFFAFDGVKNIKNIYLPSSFEKASISSFSNLNLDYLYVNKTANPINFIDLGTGIMPGSSISYAPSLYNTTINEAVVFEEYDNPNLSNFPYSSLNFKDGNSSDHILVSKNKKIVNYDTLNEAFNDFDTVSLAYCFNKKQIIETGVIDVIEKNKKLLIEQQKENVYSFNDVLKFKNNLSFDSDNSQAFKTLKLSNDLIIKGEVVIGGEIGRNCEFDSDLTGHYGSIDLNGHKLTIENEGKLINYGMIIDSSLEKSGLIEVKEGGILQSNFSIKGYTTKENGYAQYDNYINPFRSYKFNSLRCKVNLLKNSSLKGLLKYNDINDYLINDFISPSGLISNTESDILLDNMSNEYETITIKEQASFNYINLFKDNNSKDIYFPIANADNHIICENIVEVNSKMIVEGDGVLDINHIRLKANIIVNEAKDYSSYVNYPNNVTKDGELIIRGNVEGDIEFPNVGIFGNIKVNDTNYDSVKNIFREHFDKFNYLKEGCLDNNNLHYQEITNKILNINIISDSKSCVIKDNYTYLEKVGSDGYLRKNDSNNEGQLLAKYTSSNSNWIANVNNKEIVTDINKSENLSTFDVESKKYALINGNWNELNVENEDHIYIFDSKKYIFVDNEYKEGDLSSLKIFKTLDNQEYIYNSTPGINEWRTIRYYENNRIIKENNYDNYYYLSSDVYLPCDEYNLNNHCFKVGGSQYIYIGTDEGFVLNNNSLEDYSDGAKFIYLDNKGWTMVDSLDLRGKATINETNTHYYYYLNNKKWIEAKNFNENTSLDHEIIYFDTPYVYMGNEYKYAISEYDKNSKNRYTNKVVFVDPEIDYSKINIKEEDYKEIWSKVLESIPDNYKDIILAHNAFTIHRHFKEDDGKLYLYYQEDGSSQIEKKCFEFVSGFVPVNPGHTEDIIGKYNFMTYKVIFEGETTSRTIYLGLDTLAGYSDTDDYLAFGIFQDKTPIQLLN